MAEFDPLGLVKAMGPQRDPYSWAELYAKDAAQSQQLRDEMKNRMLIQEMTRAERAKEGQLSRESHERIARERERGADRRTKLRVDTRGTASKDWLDPPEGTMSEQEYLFKSFSRRVKEGDYALVVKNGKNYRVPKTGLAKLPKDAVITSPAARPAPVVKDEFDDDDDDE